MSLFRRSGVMPPRGSLLVQNSVKRSESKPMPHVIIKYFDTVLTDANKAALADAVTQTLVETLGCASGAVSIALRPIAPEDWNETVFIPDINRLSAELIKIPDYAAPSAASEVTKESHHV